MKRLIVIALAIMMCLIGKAESWTDENGTTWNFNISGGKATISSGGTYSGDLTIPSTVYVGETAYTVTSIGGDAFQGCSLTSINIPEGVTSIGSWAFQGCSNLKSIHIPEGVTSIGSWAFSSCSNLKSINIPEGVTSIGSNAFQNCYNIQSLYITDIKKWLQISFGDRYSCPLNSTDKDVKLYVDNTLVSTLDIPEGITTIPDYAFRRCSSLTSINIPEGVTSIGSNAFFCCYNLTSINIPDGVTTIPDYAFFYCSSLTSINIPEGVTSIGSKAFSGCSSLTSINIPEGVTSIGSDAFSGCSNLQSVQLSPQTTQISSRAFSNCSRLTEFHLPPYLQSIGDYTFSNCSNLKDIYAYMIDVPTINTNTFNNYQHQILYVPQFLYNKYYYDTNWSQFLDVRVCDLQPGDYESFYTNSDVVFEDGERIDQDTPDVEIGEQGGVIVEGDDPQHFDDVEQNVDENGNGGSIIGENDGENGNIIVNKLKLKLQVKANEWIGFNFPYEVTIAECEYPGQHVWIEYDGEARANGGSGWKVVEETEGAKLEANKGYMFMSSAKGKLIVTFEHPSFGGDKPQPLQSYSSGNAANAGWNFIGNPYSSYYAIDENDFSAPITVWNGTSYEAYRPGDDDYHLQPYQAFFVQMPQHVYVVNFSEEGQETYLQSQQTQANQAKMRKAAGIRPDRLLINLNIGDEETESIDRTRLVLNEKASRNYELECDAAKFISDVANAQLYLLENGVQMAIDERPTKGDIRLGYMAKQPGTLRIEASRMDMPLMLVDTKTGQTFDLSLGSYEFQTEAGTFNKRFMLRLSEAATAIKKLTEKTGVAIGMQDGGLSIGGAEGKSVSIYNANGVQVAQQSGNGFVSLPSGLYLVQVDDWSAKIYVK